MDRNDSPEKNIILGVAYQHPKQKDNHFLKYLKETLNKVTRENKKVILTRDFNLNLKFDSKAEVGYFLDLITMNCTLIKPNLQKTLKN